MPCRKRSKNKRINNGYSPAIGALPVKYHGPATYRGGNVPRATPPAYKLQLSKEDIPVADRRQPGRIRHNCCLHFSDKMELKVPPMGWHRRRFNLAAMRRKGLCHTYVSAEWATGDGGRHICLNRKPISPKAHAAFHSQLFTQICATNLIGV